MAKKKSAKEKTTESKGTETEEIEAGNPPDENQEKKKQYDLSQGDQLIAAFRDDMTEEALKDLISGHIETLLSQSGLTGYQVALLYDNDNSINTYHSNKIYECIRDIKNKKNILLVLHSGGGKIEPAYLISKACKRLCKSKFIVSVPRRAKSAATLISLGADEIHMGHLSELGPIDPQFSGLPALGLSNAIEKIAELTERYPSASDMFAKYLTDNVNIGHLGLFERVNESAVQYAERLLAGKSLPEDQTVESLADHFTNHYKDHSFVIDADEACTLFGSGVVKEYSKEYEFGDSVYVFLEFVDFMYGYFKKKEFRYVGSIGAGIHITDKKE